MISSVLFTDSLLGAQPVKPRWTQSPVALAVGLADTVWGDLVAATGEFHGSGSNLVQPTGFAG